MKTIEINLYKFAELSEEAKQKAIEINWDINVNFDWWNTVYEDAKNIGLIITEFDIDYKTISATFDDGAEQTAPEILSQHGDTCETYNLALKYLSDRDALIENTQKDENGEYIDEYQLDADLDELDAAFLSALKKDYLLTLKKECEYLTSKDQIIETLESNDYDFTVGGEIY